MKMISENRNRLAQQRTANLLDGRVATAAVLFQRVAPCQVDWL